jgi:hypothetical protein
MLNARNRSTVGVALALASLCVVVWIVWMYTRTPSDPHERERDDQVATQESMRPPSDANSRRESLGVAPAEEPVTDREDEFVEVDVGAYYAQFWPDRTPEQIRADLALVDLDPNSRAKILPLETAFRRLIDGYLDNQVSDAEIARAIDRELRWPDDDLHAGISSLLYGPKLVVKFLTDHHKSRAPAELLAVVSEADLGVLDSLVHDLNARIESVARDYHLARARAVARELEQRTTPHSPFALPDNSWDLPSGSRASGTTLGFGNWMFNLSASTSAFPEHAALEAQMSELRAERNALLEQWLRDLARDRGIELDEK